MTDTRPICIKCQTSMVCVKNGVVIRYSSTSRQKGDVYECPICKQRIISGFGAKFPIDPNSDSEATFHYRRGL